MRAGRLGVLAGATVALLSFAVTVHLLRDRQEPGQVHGAPPDAQYSAGVTTLQGPGFPVEVWYPTAETVGATRRYDLGQLNPLLRDAVVETEAIGDADSQRQACPCPAVVLVHGVGTTRSVFSRLGSDLARRGYLVAAPEWESVNMAALASTGLAFHTDMFDLVSQTIETLVGSHLGDLVDAGPPIVGGHALGGGLAQRWVAEHQALALLRLGSGGSGVVPDGTPTPGANSTPTLFIVAPDDLVTPTEAVRLSYEQVSGPRVAVWLEGGGSLAMVELCTAVGEIGAEGGAALESGAPVPDAFAFELYEHDCANRHGKESQAATTGHVVSFLDRVRRGQDPTIDVPQFSGVREIWVDTRG